MDRRLKWVVGRWSWLGCGRGWVVAEVALMMIFLNGFASVGFKSAGFQISGVSF